MDTSELISTAEVAKILGIDRSGVIKRVATGELIPAKKLSGRTGAYLFDRSDFADAEADR